jgi:Ca-activated chloride channel family protein
VSATLLVHPEWLAPAIAIWMAAAIAVAGAQWAAGRRHRKLLGTGAGRGARRRWNDAALLVALGAIAIAMLGPRMGERAVWTTEAGVDVVFAVDVSRSMDAGDVPPSRLDRARRAVEELLGRLAPPDRAALAAFGDRGVLLAPLTPDRAALAELLSALDTRLVHPAASNLGDGVRAALEAFEAGSERPRVVLVLSDGEDPERRGDLGGGEARRAGVRVLAAALGTELGAPVPDRGGPMRDATGAVVVSRRNGARLERLVAATGGEVFLGDEWGSFDFDRVASAIRRDAGAAAGESVERRVRAVRVVPFAALAFALLLAEGVPRPRISRAWGRGALLALTVLFAAFLGGASPRPLEGDDLLARGRTDVARRHFPHPARRLIHLGLARLERGEHRAARRAFLAAAVRAEDPATAATAYYDLGVAALSDGDWETARDAFFDALALDPADRQARFNLEWTLRVLDRRPPPPPPKRAPEEEPAPNREPAEDPGEPGAAARKDAAGEGRPTPPSSTPLSDEELRRWLARVEDDPARSLRSASRRDGTGASGRGRGAGAAW